MVGKSSCCYCVSGKKSRLTREEETVLSKTPAISVVMSVCNGSAYLPQAVESILAQSWCDFEFIIIDDGSTDGTLDILRTYESKDTRIHVVSRENTGLTRALNEGISRARGQFIARMDADDIAEPSRLDLQIGYLQAQPECVAVGCSLLLTDPDGDPLAEEESPLTHDQIVAKLRCGIGSLPHPTAVIRRDALNSVGGYRESFLCAQDLDLWLRLAEVGSLANLPQALLRYRLHPESVTSQNRELQLASAERAVREAYERNNEPLPIELHLPLPQISSLQRTYRSWARMASRSGNRAVARKHAWNALCAAPFSLSNVGIAATLLMPRLKKAG